MIRFHCHCTNPFEVADDQAGGLLQCPKCGRLVDVPSLSDLANLNEDGTYRIGDKVPEPQASRLPGLKRTYGHDKIEADGREIDLRPTPADVAAAGTEYAEFDLVKDMHASPPKYDPITGELVLPMPIRPDQALDTPVSQIPVAVPVLGYASGRTQSGMEDVVRNPFVALFSPPNLFVMFVIFVMHPAGTMLTIAAIGMMGMIGMKLLAVLMFVVIVAHYGMVLEEMAIEARNDLPRPLRDLQLYEDVFLPFCHVVVAMVVCYWPLIVLLAVGGPAYPLVLADLALLLLGSFFFPAVLLTAVTSGTLLNLWPPRVLAVISCIGLRYLLHVVFFMAAALVYLLGVAGTCVGLAFWLLVGGQLPIYLRGFVGYPMLALGIYLMHAFCWIMGWVYQRHHVEFPWVLQRHVRSQDDEVTR